MGSGSESAGASVSSRRGSDGALAFVHRCPDRSRVVVARDGRS